MDATSNQKEPERSEKEINNITKDACPVAAQEVPQLRWFNRIVSAENLPNIVIALATAWLAAFATVAWLETKKGTVALYQALQLDQRATLKIVNWNINKNSFANNRGPVIGFDFVNTGHTAAYMVSGIYDYTIAPSLPKSFDLREQGLFGFPAVIAQGETFPFKITLPIIDANSISDIKNGRSFLYLRVTALFQDFAGTRYKIITTGQYGGAGFQFPELPISNEPQLVGNCQFAADRKFNTYQRIPCP
jgi:hypothetical protein